jgi:hypothetical protein
MQLPCHNIGMFSCTKHNTHLTTSQNHLPCDKRMNKNTWWMRRFTTMPPLTDYDGQGCNDTGCIPECRFFAETGRIDDSEITKLKEEENKKEKELIEAEYRILGFNDDDSDDVKRAKWAEIHELKRRILKEKSEYLEQRQHTWQSCDDLKAIEDAAWTEFYKSKNNNTEQLQQSQ